MQFSALVVSATLFAAYLILLSAFMDDLGTVLFLPTVLWLSVVGNDGRNQPDQSFSHVFQV